MAATAHGRDAEIPPRADAADAAGAPGEAEAGERLAAPVGFPQRWQKCAPGDRGA